MKSILRITIEVVIISFLALFLNNSFSQEKKQEITWPNLIGVAKPVWNAKELPEVASYDIFRALSQSGYIFRNNLFPSMGYDQRLKRLIPITISLKYPIGREPIPSEGIALLFAGYRDSAASSFNDLEERVRKLENKVAQIEKECCR